MADMEVGADMVMVGHVIPYHRPQHRKKEPEPLTADQIVDNEMPEIASALELNEFETAVLSSILKKYVQERIEMQILKLTPEQMREQMDKITVRQTEELKAGLPLEKYEAFVELQKKGVSKTKKGEKEEAKKAEKEKKRRTKAKYIQYMKKLFPLFLSLTTFIATAQRPQGQSPEPINITGIVLDQDTGDPLNMRP